MSPRGSFWAWLLDSRSSAPRVLFVILGTALFLRLWGINYGLPDIYHTDEWFEVKRALKLGAGVFDIERVGKGGYYYLLFVVFGAYYAVLRVLGSVGGSADFLMSIFRDPTGLWIAGRSTTALIGTVNVWLIYRAGLRWRGRAVGLLAAAFLAVTMLHVNSSHYITVDVPLVCLLTFGWALVYEWQDRDDLTGKHYALLAIVTSAATATKLPGAVFLLCVLAMHLVIHRRQRRSIVHYFIDRRLWIYLGLGALVYVAADPGMVFKIGDVLRGFFSFAVPGEAVDPGDVVFPERFANLPRFYALALFPPVYTILPMLFLAGVFVAIRRDGLLRQPAIFFAVVYVVFLVTSQDTHQIYHRYVLPLIPIVLLYASLALVEAHRALASRHKLAKLVAPLLALIVGIPMLVHTVALDLAFGRPDTRTVAREWVEENVPAGATVVLSGRLARASAQTAQLKIMPERIDEKVALRLDTTGRVMGADKSLYYEVYKRALAEYDPTYDLIFFDEQEELRRALADDRGDWALLHRSPQYLPFPEQHEFVRRIDAGDYEVVQRFQRGEGMVGPDLILYKRSERAVGVP